MVQTPKHLTRTFESSSVLVTGGAGFIGSHLVEALVKAGALVRVLDDLSTGNLANLNLDSGRVEVMEGDIRDLATCRRAASGATYVFHQAARGSVPRSIEDPAGSLSVNVGGTTNVFTAAMESGVQRIVYASSSSVYGDSDRIPKREGEEGRPLSPYALSKRLDEHIADIFSRCYGTQLIGLRYFNVYGPRQSPNGPYAAAIPRFIASCLSRQPLTIFGDGSQARDFTFVADVVSANLLAALAPTGSCGRAYNIGTGHSVTISDVARTIMKATHATVEPLCAPARAGDVAFSLAAVDDAEAHLGFVAEVPFTEGIRRTLHATVPASPSEAGSSSEICRGNLQ